MSAEEIENFVVSQIQIVGKNPELALDSFRIAKTQLDDQKALLTSEKAMLAENTRKLNEEARRLVMSISENNAPSTHISERLTEIEEQIKQLESREQEIQKHMVALSASVIDENDFNKVLELFLPIWEVLFPNEKTRIINHLLERVEYNGATGKLDIKYSATGIRLLALEYQKGK